MNTDDRPKELTLAPPFVAAAQFEEFTVFLRALGYQLVAVHPSPDGVGGKVVVETDRLFCPCCVVAISLTQLLGEGKCDRCRGENASVPPAKSLRDTHALPRSF